MASKDDRKSIHTITGMPLLPKTGPSIIPDHTNRWKGNPVPIHTPEPGRDIKNPYAAIGNSAIVSRHHNLSNPASQTYLRTPASRNQGFGYRDPPRQITDFRNKGKRKATAAQRPSPSEIIDVEAEHTSTDDLNIPDKPSTITSPYFDSKQEPRSQKHFQDQEISGFSLVEDGPNTKYLQSKLMGSSRDPVQETEHKSESSPIQSFSDDEVKKWKRPHKQQTGTTAFVKGKVAIYEGLEKKENKPNKTQLNPIPTLDLRKISRMQPKGGGRKIPLAISSDSLSEPSGLRCQSGRESSNKKSILLPITALRIGFNELNDYDKVVIDSTSKTIKFEGGSKDIIGPIQLTSNNFTGFQCTDPGSPDKFTHPPIFYFTTAPTQVFRALESSFGNNLFRPGKNSRGQLSMRFNPSHGRWNHQFYREAVINISRFLEAVQKSVLRSSASTPFWDAHSRGNIFHSGDATSSPSTLCDDGEVDDGHIAGLLGSLDQPRRNSDMAYPTMEDRLVEPSSSHADELPFPVRKRYPNHDHVKHTPEASVMERPLKRQRIEEPKPPRRSTRRREKSPSNDADEIILVYPHRVPGAVNITAGDLARLQPEEFLNDTLIEFGLKFWLRRLEETHPDIASQVHVVNSFFYKKLNKRNIKEGYDSVRKWTAKIDIFSKKYIIVPINENLHWYLAIICEPQHTLQKPAPHHPHTNAVTRQQTREMQVAKEVVEDEARPARNLPRINPDVPQVPFNEGDDSPDGTNSESEVAFLMCGSVITPAGHQSRTDHTPELEDMLINAPADSKRTSELMMGSPMHIDIDLTPEISEQPSETRMLDVTMGSGTSTPFEIPDSSQPEEPIKVVTPAKFYGKPYSTKARKKTGESIGKPIIVDDTPRTKIFIFDSLGNRHPQAMKQLNKWLELEAMDKKKMEDVTPAIAKIAPVPVQPNYCDCGLYVLHFAKTFMGNPQHYSQIIMTKERPTMAERQEDWKSDSVSRMREDLQDQIISLSEKWRQLRAAQEEEDKRKQQQPSAEEEEDSDVAIIEHVKASGKKGKAAKSSGRTRT